jgi:hypothetical protein
MCGVDWAGDLSARCADAHEIIRQADEMMYVVKNTTRDNIGIAQRGVMK